MLPFSGEESMLFMFIMTEVFFFPNAKVDLEQDQKQKQKNNKLLSGLTLIEKKIIHKKNVKKKQKKT